MTSKGIVLYIGGFELPDRNAAAQRVIGIAKGLRKLKYTVIFLNSLKNYEKNNLEVKEYFGFKCYEYKRETRRDYLLSAKTALNHINNIQPNIVIAYNYPAFALEHIRKYCKNNHIKIIADVTEWYHEEKGNSNFIYRIVKNIDSSYRMRFVHKKLDGIIAISRLLYEYYRKYTKTVMIPPTVDIKDEKWNRVDIKNDENTFTFIYAGSPSVQKERLDLIVTAIEKLENDKNVILNIVGITENQFRQIYKWEYDITNRIRFWGRISHDNALEMIKAANWTIIIRDNKFVVNAGFPTKLVESISCGTPLIANRFSNVEEYLNESNSILIQDYSSLIDAIKESMKKHVAIDRTKFSFLNYIEELKTLGLELSKDEFLHKFGAKMKVNIKFVEEIPRESSGKFRMIKNTPLYIVFDRNNGIKRIRHIAFVLEAIELKVA